jgi:hypothetical protein
LHVGYNINKTNISDLSCKKRAWIYVLYYQVFVKGKAIPLQAWADPEGSWRMRLPDFTTIGT